MRWPTTTWGWGPTGFSVTDTEALLNKDMALLKDMALVLFDPEIKIALQFYNAHAKRNQQNTVANDLLRKRQILLEAYKKVL